jgi:hypothetical protein
MTLSHCWGSVKFLTLTAETLEQLLAGLPLSSLPQTFQDAVKVSRRLGAQFLWIESLHFPRFRGRLEARSVMYGRRVSKFTLQYRGYLRTERKHWLLRK